MREEKNARTRKREMRHADRYHTHMHTRTSTHTGRTWGACPKTETETETETETVTGTETQRHRDMHASRDKMYMHICGLPIHFYIKPSLRYRAQLSLCHYSVPGSELAGNKTSVDAVVTHQLPARADATDPMLTDMLSQFRKVRSFARYILGSTRVTLSCVSTGTPRGLKERVRYTECSAPNTQCILAFVGVCLAVYLAVGSE